MNQPPGHGNDAPRPSRPSSQPSTPVPLAIRSSAAFLHHLHTDPSSHHITLSGSTSRDGISEPPRMTATTMERSGSGHASHSNTSRVKESTTSVESVAGPSSPRGLVRTNSRRRRAATSVSDSEAIPGTGTHSRIVSGELEQDIPSEEIHDDDLPQLAAEGEESGDQSFIGDGCLGDLALEEANARRAMNLLSLAGSPVESPEGPPGLVALSGASSDPDPERRGSGQSSSSGSLIIGRAGSLAAQASSSTPHLPPAGPSPVDQLNWSTFARSYAHGLFDPNKIPIPPNPMLDQIKGPSTQSSPARRPATALPAKSSTTGSGSYSSQAATASRSGSSPPSTIFSSTPSSSGSLPSASAVAALKENRSMSELLDERKKAFEFQTAQPFSESNRVSRPDKLVLPAYNLATATVRMAASNLRSSDLHPLGIPSPDRELVDPMHAFVSPGESPAPKSSASSDPGSSRLGLSRSVSSIYGPTVERGPLLPTIAASPVSTPNEGSHKAKGKAPEPAGRDSDYLLHRGGRIPHHIPAASVPLERTADAAATDYFGHFDSPPGFDRHHSYVSQSSSSKTGTTVTATPIVQGKSKSSEQSNISLPTSSAPQGLAPPQPAAVEQAFEQLGWLPAPMPPDEEARRRALYRYNILHTAPDVNFDRIAHMIKLVFSSKIVLISLIDATEQAYKAESGLGASSGPRLQSFCSHAILAKSGEPFIVLDTLKDWRFVNHPFVRGVPNIRFYAGAPLQTPEGFNIGSLCIIDDKPRSEFTPRSRLILKEFASIAMREMELWRDKLQLRVRERIQTSMERFTRECLEMDGSGSKSNAEAATKMDQVYNRATQLICSTLDLEGTFILDISQFEMMELALPSGRTTIYRADPYIADDHSPVLERSEAFGPVNALPVYAKTADKQVPRALTSVEHEKLSDFLRDHKDGRIFEGIAPSWIRYMFPQDLRFGLLVPIFGVDNQPFALLGSYTSKQTRQFLEGYELQFLRAIGVIILSAVLRRRMVMADKAKSILISSVSHELRTPLHGILAAAELLADTELDANQVSFLKTVTTCGNSLIETVNHVLDFTKLSGTSQGLSSTIKLSRVNLSTLVEQTVEGCWIGQRARHFHGDSEIGSFYAPDAPHGLIPRAQRATMHNQLAHVETVIDIATREKGWVVKCEKGGLRRVIMNLVGNSLKFTTDGYIQVTLRELPHEANARKIPVEIAVIDTGKGIGKEFLKDQLFHPFSQENPLQTGTGLGLAIVNSIVRSESVNGKVDVWSSEGMGTEIRVSFEVEVAEEDEDTSSVSSAMSMASHPGRGKSLSFFSFAEDYRGQMLSLEVLGAYAAAAGFELREKGEGDIYVIHEDEEILEQIKDFGRPVILITSGRTSQASAIRGEMQKNGGSLQILYKPVGPAAFRRALCIAVDHMDEDSSQLQRNMSRNAIASPDERRPSITRGSSGASTESGSTISDLNQRKFAQAANRAPLLRRRSDEADAQIHSKSNRPPLHPRGVTYHHPPQQPSRLSHASPPRPVSGAEDTPSVGSSNSPQPGSPSSALSTISLADGGVMLKAATVPSTAPRRERVPRVLIVEDNVINRRVLGAFLKKKGIEYAEAVDGGAGVDLFENSPANYWDVILMDISMPVLNGHEATRAIRKVEASRRRNSSNVTTPLSETPPTAPITLSPSVPTAPQTVRIASSDGSNATSIKLPPTKILQSRAKIFALTGLATADDKREAFGSGVDGYLVKPVSLKSLGLIFSKIGFPIDP